MQHSGEESQDHPPTLRFLYLEREQRPLTVGSSEIQCTIQFECDNDEMKFSLSLRLILPCSYTFESPNVRIGDTETWGHLLDLSDARLDLLLLFALPSSSSTTGTNKIEPWFYLPSCLNITLQSLLTKYVVRGKVIFSHMSVILWWVGGSVHPRPDSHPQTMDLIPRPMNLILILAGPGEGLVRKHGPLLPSGGKETGARGHY